MTAIKLETSLEISEHVKQDCVAILTLIQNHHLKGAEHLVSFVQTVSGTIDTLSNLDEQLKGWHDVLLQLLHMLKPFFEIARDFIVTQYNHLLGLFDWCKKKWHELFG